MKSNEIVSEETCQLCGRLFRFGPHIYDGHYLPNYGIMCCKVCVPSKSSDIPSIYENLLSEICLEGGKPSPRRDVNGNIPALPDISIRRYPKN